ncbi:MAG: LysR family nitrogen assimilation transcriptional regulator [Halieaceae bacterium]|jgi:LysR family nitrogen assimilation transcriptional regulator
MNLKQLQYFIMVAESGGFSQASDAAHLAQSALSRHVRLLEENLHTRLFDRTGRGVVLTEQGEYLLEHSRAILVQVQHVERSLQSWYEHPIGRVRVGMTPTGSINSAALLIRELRTLYPKVDLHVSEGISAELCNRVLDGQLDLALVFEEPRSDLLRTELLRQEPLCLVTAPGLDLSDPVPMTQLQSMNLILPTRHGRIRVAVERSCAAANVSCEPTYTVDSVATMKNLAANGDGVAVLTRQSVETEVGVGLLSVYSLDDPKLVLPMFVTYRAKQQLGRAAAATLEAVRRLFSD